MSQQPAVPEESSSIPYTADNITDTTQPHIMTSATPTGRDVEVSCSARYSPNVPFQARNSSLASGFVPQNQLINDYGLKHLQRRYDVSKDGHGDKTLQYGHHRRASSAINTLSTSQVELSRSSMQV